MNDESLSPQEERLTRFLDGQLDPTQRQAFAEEMSAADAAAEKARAEALRHALQEHCAPELPYPDFFSSQLLKRIREEAEPARPQRSTFAPLLDWLRSPWAFGAAAAALLVLFGVVQTGTAEETTRVLSVYSPEPSATAESYYEAESGIVVIDVQGLPELPPERKIVGNNGSDTAGLVATLAP